MEHELDTQNFERFDEDMAMSSPSQNPARKPWAQADPNFIGYTYKNWEAVHVAAEGQGGSKGVVALKKKAPARPSLQQVQSNLQAMGLTQQQQQQQQQAGFPL